MSSGATPRKPSADIYTLLLGLALLAIIIATVFAYLEANSTEYGSPPYQGALPRVRTLQVCDAQPLAPWPEARWGERGTST